MRILFLFAIIALCVSFSNCDNGLPSNEALANITLKKIDANPKENPPAIKLPVIPSAPGKVFAWQVADNQKEVIIYGEDLTVVDSIQIGKEIFSLSKKNEKTAIIPIPQLPVESVAPVWVYSDKTKFRMRHRYAADSTARPQVLDCTIGTDTIITKVNITINKRIFIYCKLSKEVPVHAGPRSIYFGYNYVPFKDFIVFGGGKEIIIEVDTKNQYLIDTARPFSIDYGDGVRIPTLKCL